MTVADRAEIMRQLRDARLVLVASMPVRGPVQAAIQNALAAMDAAAEALAEPPQEGKETCYPVLRSQPTLMDVVKMEQGRLAKHAFGAPTDPVFVVERVPNEPRPSASPATQDIQPIPGAYATNGETHWCRRCGAEFAGEHPRNGCAASPTERGEQG